MADENLQAEAAPAAPAATAETTEFDQLLSGAFKPKTDHAKDAISTAVQTLAEQARMAVRGELFRVA